MKRRLAVASVATVAALSCVAAAAAATRGTDTPLASKQVGRQADNSVLTPVNQFLTPAGRAIHLKTGRFLDSAISPDGRTAVASAWHEFAGSVVVVDLTTGTIRQQVTPAVGSGDVSIRGILWARDGRSVWVAQSKDLLRFPVHADGTIGTPDVITLPTGAPAIPTTLKPQDALPSGLAWAPDGKHLLVTLNGLNTLARIDATTGAVKDQVPVGVAPRDVTVAAGKAYVANQGGRPATDSDFVNYSYGTKVVSDPRDGRASTGTVSEVDLSTWKTVATFRTGLQPTSLLAHGRDLLVTNSNDDSVTVIDTARQRVGQTIDVNPAPGRPYGASPNALAFVDATHLVVSLGRDNALAVYAYKDAYTPVRFDGLIPTGFYPGVVQWDAALGKLVVTNLKGVGALGPKSVNDQGPGTSPAPSQVKGHNTYDDTGSINLVNLPSASAMQTYTEQVFANNQWNGLVARNQQGSGRAASVAVPVRLGDPSKIKHVFLIVKENRTYDQVLGDDPRGNGDPSLTQFGAKVTPNHHALARRGPLIDNLYGGGTLSADGHNWLTQAFVNDYIEREFGNFTRSYPAQGADALAYAKSGFIWDNALRHGLTARSWGEYANFWTGPGGVPASGDWAAWYHDSQVLEGARPGPLNFRPGYYRSSSDVPSLQRILAPKYPKFELEIPDQYRADLFAQDLSAYEKSGDLPALNLMWVMADHTAGTAPGFPTPASMVADNDLATGRIIDAISHSSYWKDTAVFVVEDDTQNGVDHVEGHRNVALVASPYAKRGVVHTYYSQLNLMRTIEQILGLPPMNQMDLAAVPMRDAFTDTPDFRPYDAIKNRVLLDVMNPVPTAASNPAAKAWSAWASKQNFKSEDMVNMGQLNRDIYYSSNGFTKPYPGDARVLLPGEVPGAGTRSQIQDADD